jgi:hypothetical protein
MPGIPSFEVYEANPAQSREGLFDGWLFLRDADASSPEQACIHGPCTWSNHRQRDAQRRQHDVHRSTAAWEQEKGQFRNTHEQARDWCPETNDQERGTGGREQLQGYWQRQGGR